MAEPIKMLIVRFMLEHPAELDEAYRIAHPAPVRSETGLTFRQRQLLDFIEAYSARHRTMPSFEEMAVGVGLKSKSGIARMVQALEDRGFIQRPLRQRARSMQLVGAQS